MSPWAYLPPLTVLKSFLFFLSVKRSKNFNVRPCFKFGRGKEARPSLPFLASTIKQLMWLREFCVLVRNTCQEKFTKDTLTSGKSWCLWKEFHSQEKARSRFHLCVALATRRVTSMGFSQSSVETEEGNAMISLKPMRSEC